MKEQRSLRETAGLAVSRLYGYIYCMLASSILVGMPLFGGALSLCGSAMLTFLSVYRKRNRKIMPWYTLRAGLILLIVLFIIVLVLTVFYPASFNNPRVWLIFMIVALSMLVDLTSGWFIRLTLGSPHPPLRARIALWGLRLLMVSVVTGVLMMTLELRAALSLGAGFTLWTILKNYAESGPDAVPKDEEEEEEKVRIHDISAYRQYMWMSLLLIAAVEMTSVVVYGVLATDMEWMLGAMLIGVACSVAASETGLLFLRRSRKKNRKDPTWLLCVGLMLWLAGVILFGVMLGEGRVDYLRVYFCLILCSLGGTLSLNGLMKVQRLIPGFAKVTGNAALGAVERQQEIEWRFSTLLGDTLALIILCVLCFVGGGTLPGDTGKLPLTFQPVMVIPLLLVIGAALLSVLRFPLSSPYIEKLRRFLRLQESGEENPALKKQLEQVLNGPYRQPFLTWAIIAVLRPIYRHRLVNPENIRPDEHNPLVFVCNHGEFYGPVVCELFVPVPIRSWTISMMMADPKEVADYVYQYTFGPIPWLPAFVKKTISWLAGHLSVTIMRQVEAIPVYRDSPMKLRETIRVSIEAMEAGDNLMIFPENPEQKYAREGISPLSPGFVMLANAYWRKTGKRLRILPMYANKVQRTLTFGEEIVFRPEVSFSEEQDRIVRETEEQILRMAGLRKETAQQAGSEVTEE